ncbi:pentapeptide repeat-containing protein [Litoreibacter janthinus]|uniref:pentapeptide repeat-containing protein n=1 Tax=Litoreibacter janthinus TaxID=670154 RepID=UPI001113BA3F|nr:pentapeptide repeat-containing protein [Litoreibacter janthinus]
MTQGGILVAWLMLIGVALFLVLAALKRIKPKPSSSRRESVLSWLRNYYWVAMLITGVGLGIGATTFYLAEVGYSVAGIVNALRAEAWRDTPNAEDLRNLATATAVLLAALAAATTMIFQLVKVWIAERQTKTSEQSHITDQINKAVEGLGTEKNVKTDDGVETTRPNIEVRVGAIYALERIAQDSPRDHVQIMEILTAYVRENAPAASALKFQQDDFPVATNHPDLRWVDTDGWSPERIRRYLTIYWETKGRAHRKSGGKAEDNTFGQHACHSRRWAAGLRPRADIQSAMQVIARRSAKQIQAERSDPRYSRMGYQIDLRDCNLQGIKLTEPAFEGANFAGSYLDGAHLQEANLNHANLEYSHFRSADLRFSELNFANFESADLEVADLEGVIMKAVDLKNANLGGTDLTGATLDGSDLDWTDITSSDLSHTSLVMCVFKRIRMYQPARFTDANLAGGAFFSCDLSSASLTEKQLQSTYGAFDTKLGRDSEKSSQTGIETSLAFPKHWLSFPLRDYNYFFEQWRLWLDHPDTYIPHENES